MTIIALDANFRLRRRAISNEERDPALSSGWGYFVQDGPYRDYLRDHVEDGEVSSGKLYHLMCYLAHEGVRSVLVPGLQR